MPIVGALGDISASEERMSLVDVDLDILAVAEDGYKIREGHGEGGLALRAHAEGIEKYVPTRWQRCMCMWAVSSIRHSAF